MAVPSQPLIQCAVVSESVAMIDRKKKKKKRKSRESYATSSKSFQSLKRTTSKIKLSSPTAHEALENIKGTVSVDSCDQMLIPSRASRNPAIAPAPSKPLVAPLRKFLFCLSLSRLCSVVMG